MPIHATKTVLNEILALRNLFLQETNFQIRYNAAHERGWTDSYLFTSKDDKIGYASVKGNENFKDRDTVFEFYIIPSFRNSAPEAFTNLLKVSGASYIECQSNDLLLTSLLYQHGENIHSDVILFGDSKTSGLLSVTAIFRKRTDQDQVFEHRAEPVGDFVLELDGEVVATGGFLLHYNRPFADIYMEVREDCRRKGLGSFLVQQLREQCYLAGRVPAARCNRENIASKATLLKAGLNIAGFMLFSSVISPDSLKAGVSEVK